jgi:hypothetical protein
MMGTNTVAAEAVTVKSPASFAMLRSKQMALNELSFVQLASRGSACVMRAKYALPGICAAEI